MPFTYEQIRDVLNDHPTEPVPAYIAHTGGGVMAVRVDIAPEGGKPKDDDPFLLLTPREDYDGEHGIAVGYYPTWEDTGEWPTGGMRYADSLDEVHEIVMDGADSLCNPEGDR
jgi:hypothetical protein